MTLFQKLCFSLFSLVLIAPSAHAQTDRDLTARFSPEAYRQRETHRDVLLRVIGEGAQRVYLFMPEQPAVTGKAPMVFLHHGWQGVNPKNFGSLIEHLVRTGHVVVFPTYQDSDKTPPQIVTDAAAGADRVALDVLEKDFGITPDPARVLYLGYSMGSAISINIALNPQRYGLPAPRALVLMAPGDAYHVAKGAQAKSIIGSVKHLPANLPVALITGEADATIGLPTARLLAAQMCQIHPDRRVLMVLPSDEHLGDKVLAGHGSPGAPDSRYDFELSRNEFPLRISPRAPTGQAVEMPDSFITQLLGKSGYERSGSMNQLDFYGYWKVIDGVTQGLKTGVFPESVFSKTGQITREQTFLGAWPDGTPYKPAKVERFCSTNK